MKPLVFFGLMILLFAIFLIVMRMDIAGTPMSGEGDGYAILRNEVGEQSLLAVGGLLGILGIGMVLVGVARAPNPNRSGEPKG